MSVEDVSLEHVMPQSLSDEWSAIDEETHRSCFRRIGNLAILSADDNTDIGNMGFTGKKRVFKVSSFQTTKRIASFIKWGPDEITKRQDELAELAVKTWPLSGDMRRRATRKTTKKATKKGVKRTR